jgi:MFS transporter, DHA1 family, purine base/nucleoside efflux pump
VRRTTFSLLCLEGAVLSFNVAATAALIPSIAKEFNVSGFVAGRITWLYMLPYGVAALFYGPLVRKFDAKKVELACFFLFCAANLLAATASDMRMLYVARVLMGVFGASVVPLVLILISQYCEPENKGKLTGIFFSATFVASLLGLSLSAVLPWRMIYFIPAVFGFLVWVHMYRYLQDFKRTSGSFAVHYHKVFRNKTVVLVLSYIFLISLFYHGVQQWLAVFFSKAYGFDQCLISILITLTSLSGIIGEVAGGWFSDSLGRIKVVNLGIALMILSVLTLCAKLPFTAIAIVMLVWGFGWTLNHAGLSTLLTDLPKEFINESASLNSSIRFISAGIGVTIGSILLQKSFLLHYSVFAGGLFMLLLMSKKFLPGNLKGGI